MSKILTLVYGDLRQVFRDSTLLSFLFVPVVLLLFIRLFVPFLTEKFPVIAEYHPFIMMFGGMQTAIMFGFVTSFIILDEKDENVLQAIRVLPVSPFYFMLSRLLFATFFSSLGAWLTISFGGIAYPGAVNTILLSVQYGLTAPFIALIIATYAGNKVEGMAFFKGVDLVLLLPMLSFFLTGTIKYVFALIPVYWTYALYDSSLNGGQITLQFFVGLCVYLIVIAGLFLQFKKRVFER